MLSFIRNLIPKKKFSESFVPRECEEKVVIVREHTFEKSSFLSEWKKQSIDSHSLIENSEILWEASSPNDPFVVKFSVFPVPSSLMSDSRLNFIGFSNCDGYPIFEIMGADISDLVTQYETEELHTLSS